MNKFHERGHKLLVYHGWSDWLVVPGESIRYRNALASGPSGNSLNAFYRLFMVPGMNHCSSGVGPDRFDALKAVVDWVERDIPPDRLVATQFPPDQHSGTPLRTRPLCPYPQVARYRGHGSVDNEASFVCAQPER